jgi:RNA polymerase sigma-70 factor (ECF subfamily)
MIAPVSDANAITDMQLLGRFVCLADRSALSELFRRHEKRVFATCYRRLGSYADAQDAAQQVFVALMSAAPKIETSVERWLQRCAVHVSVSMIRSSQSRARREGWVARDVVGHIGVGADGDAMAHRETLGILDDCLGELAEADRDILIQNYVHEVPQRAIASTLGVSQQAIGARIHRAAGQLRRKLSKRGVALGAAGVPLLLSRDFAAASLFPATSAAAAATTVAGSGLFCVSKAGAIAAAAALLATAVTYECTHTAAPAHGAASSQVAVADAAAAARAAGASAGHRGGEAKSFDGSERLDDTASEPELAGSAAAKKAAADAAAAEAKKAAEAKIAAEAQAKLAGANPNNPAQKWEWHAALPDLAEFAGGGSGRRSAGAARLLDETRAVEPAAVGNLLAVEEALAPVQTNHDAGYLASVNTSGAGHSWSADGSGASSGSSNGEASQDPVALGDHATEVDPVASLFDSGTGDTDVVSLGDDHHVSRAAQSSAEVAAPSIGVPEPAALALLGLGAFTLFRRR